MLDKDIQDIVLKLAQCYLEYKHANVAVTKEFWKKRIDKYEKILVNLTHNRYEGKYK